MTLGTVLLCLQDRARVFPTSMRMLDLPFFQLDPDPESIDPHSDDRQQEPFDPVAEQLHGRAVKRQPVSVDHGMLCFPAIDHAKRPRETDPDRTHRHQEPQQIPSDQLKKTAVKVGFILSVHGTYPLSQFLLQETINPLLFRKALPILLPAPQALHPPLPHCPLSCWSVP